jgi:XTP/dITP diphosphohydrolase
VKRLIIGTTNPGKVIEIRCALGELRGWSLDALPPGTPSIEETGETFLENAIVKAEHYSRLVSALTLADDSGLCVAALGGRPGIHSARYAPDPPARIKRILQEMRGVPDGQRQAVFYCALAVARRGETIWKGQGEVAGVIAHTPSGTAGFGYDPVFFLPELGQTMADLGGTDDKNRLSARGKAVAKLREFLLSLRETTAE